ncbi:MAG: hypothetical protein OXQ29_00735, partial [Rhodospirillaceae bacterium]|nr:hypothetical protein [Rhodospirillaceae bacterium]
MSVVADGWDKSEWQASAEVLFRFERMPTMDAITVLEKVRVEEGKELFSLFLTLIDEEGNVHLNLLAALRVLCGLKEGTIAYLRRELFQHVRFTRVGQTTQKGQ